jgi:hypothetical protein
MWTDFDSDIYNSANMVVYFDEEDDDLYLRLRAMSHTVYAAIFEQIITQHVFLRRESQSYWWSIRNNIIVF